MAFNILNIYEISWHYAAHVDLAFNSVEHFFNTLVNIGNFNNIYLSFSYLLPICNSNYNNLLKSATTTSSLVDVNLNIDNKTPIKDKNSLSDVAFFEWLRGFSDGDASFMISHSRKI